MAKHKLNQSHVLKINSSRLKKEKYDLKITANEAKTNQEIVSLGSSQTLRFIQQWENKQLGRPENFDREYEINKLKREIKALKKEKTSKANKKKIAAKYEDLHSLMNTEHYDMIVMDSKADFDRLNSKKRFKINNRKMNRLLATTGGGKQSTVVYTTDDVYPYLDEKLNMGRDMSKEIVPAKLEAYKALACSASIPLSKPKGVLVVKDVETSFLANVITIDDTKSDYPIVKPEENFLINMNASDGFGLMTPERSEIWGKELRIEGFPSLIIRNGYTKGKLSPFDFLYFAENEAKTYTVPDAWGEPRDIRNYDVILTTSMVKLWDSYRDLEHLQECWDMYGYSFAATKATPEQLDNAGNLNYQFIQSLDLSDEEIAELISQTVQELKDVLGGDYRKALVYLNGKNLNEKSIFKMNPDFIQALMIDKEMINDPYVRTHIHKMIRNRINEAKTGVLKVSGNFSVMSGDPYTLCQSIFGMPPTGLLKEGEFYSKYWIDKGVSKVAAFRAPMTNHNNIRIFRFKDNEETAFWYQYMKNVTILNSWDTTTHALNGADFDGDQVFTTDNKVILNNVRELDAIICMQKQVDKVVPTEDDLIKANKASFGDEIGTTTNRITSMFDVLARYEKDTPQYNEIMYRIMSGQMIQQNVIDKTKGVEAKGMPKEWYVPKLSYPPVLCDDKGKAIKDSDGNVIPLEETEEQRQARELNLEIVADKKPYFFIWKKNSPELVKYRKYIENAERNCYIRFGMTVKQLIQLEKRNEDQETFLKYYYDMMPVSVANSTMNRICWKIEKEFEGISTEIKASQFDKEMLKTDTSYSLTRYREISKLYKQHSIEMSEYMKRKINEAEDEETKEELRLIFANKFEEAASMICNNAEELCNIVVDMCYGTKANNKSKQFAWDVAGEQIIVNLLNSNNYTYSIPVLSEQGEFEYAGDQFKMIHKKMEGDSY